MEYILYLQTGFYKKTVYSIEIEKHTIILSPSSKDKDEIIKIFDKDITAVVVYDIKNPEIEIQTYSKTYTGSFEKDTDIIDLLDLMKENLRTDFIFKGGR